jgi:hypothetical protein
MKSKYHAALVIVWLVSTALENRPLRIESLSCESWFPDALIVSAVSFFEAQRNQIIRLAALYSLPRVYSYSRTFRARVRQFRGNRLWHKTEMPSSPCDVRFWNKADKAVYEYAP